MDINVSYTIRLSNQSGLFKQALTELADVYKRLQYSNSYGADVLLTYISSVTRDQLQKAVPAVDFGDETVAQEIDTEILQANTLLALANYMWETGIYCKANTNASKIAVENGLNPLIVNRIGKRIIRDMGKSEYTDQRMRIARAMNQYVPITGSFDAQSNFLTNPHGKKKTSTRDCVLFNTLTAYSTGYALADQFSTVPLDAIRVCAAPETGTSLSAYSTHAKDVAQTSMELDALDAHGLRTLFAADEIGAGTKPIEGQTMALSLLTNVRKHDNVTSLMICPERDVLRAAHIQGDKLYGIDPDGKVVEVQEPRDLDPLDAFRRMGHPEAQIKLIKEVHDLLLDMENNGALQIGIAGHRAN